jgi:2',3'-cyclic-nucleotide 2'-phosphodiesterase/3'-nucleotidase
MNGIVCAQPLNNGQNFTKVVIDTETKEVSYELVDVSKLTDDINEDLEKIFEDVSVELDKYLNEEIGEFDKDIIVNDLFEARLNGNPLINFIHQVQIAASEAEISVLSLFDSTIGFKKNVSIRDVLINYPYPNTLKVLKVSGHKLKEAMEKAATYFVVEDGEVKINNGFLVPKVQNYNYDMFYGVDYEIDLNREFGDRVVSITKNGKAIDLEKEYNVVLNNYRATNTSIYPAYENAKIVKEVNVDISELIINYFQENKKIKVDENRNYIIKQF